MHIIDEWVDSTNLLMEFLDKELLTIRKNSYETAAELNKGCGELDKNTKEQARMKEKARLLPLNQEIGYLRRQIAKLVYDSRRRSVICVFEVVIFAILCFQGTPAAIVVGLVCLLAGLFSLGMTYFYIRKSSDLIIQACSRYGVIEANIKVFDYRDLETINLERLPFPSIKYSREDLIGSW